jgi:hypothetical protein
VHDSCFGRLLATHYLLSAFVAIYVHPGETPQGWHLDDGGWADAARDACPQRMASTRSLRGAVSPLGDGGLPSPDSGARSSAPIRFAALINRGVADGRNP